MLEARALTKRYDETIALDRLDLVIPPGEVFCLLGANGAGKTTTIHLFLGFVAPTSGSAAVNGLDVATHALETKRQLAYIPEQVSLYPNLTGIENLDYFSSLAGTHYDTSELTDYLTTAGLDRAAANRRVETYSKGMRQKVGVAIALAKRAQALLLDEPTSGLDPQASNEFSGIIERVRDQGVAVLMATHDLFRAKELGNRIGIMRAGRLVETLAPADVGHADLEQIYLKHMHA